MEKPINEAALEERVQYLMRCASQSMELIGLARVVAFSWPLDEQASLIAAERLEAMGWNVVINHDHFLATPPEVS